MQLLKFSVRKQVVRLLNYEPIVVAKSKGHVFATFDLDEDWSDLSVTVIFENKNHREKYAVLLDSEQIKVPHEILVAGSLYVSLEGLGDDGNIRMTTLRMCKPIQVRQSGALTGILPPDTNPEFWEQVLSRIGNLSKLETENKSSLVAAINEAAKKVIPSRRYVEEFKTKENTWNAAFAALFEACRTSGANGGKEDGKGDIRDIACTGGKIYHLTAPLYIGDIDVDFEGCELVNEEEASDANPACVVLTGAQYRTHKFGTVTGRYSTAILIDTALLPEDPTKRIKYQYNRLSATQLRGKDHALHIRTIPANEGGRACYFNEFHLPLLRSAGIPLKLWGKSRGSGWVNECHFFLGTFEEYNYSDDQQGRIDGVPEALVHLTNVDRCNFYNMDIEASMFGATYTDGFVREPDPNHTTAVVLVNSTNCAFYNPRIAEPYNAVQFRFVGTSFNNFIDGASCKYGTIKCDEMALSDLHYNVWRGRVSTDNGGSPTNADTLRIYKDMIVPEVLTAKVRHASSNVTITADTMKERISVDGVSFLCGGIPTLLKWSGGNITLDRRFIALLPQTIQIVKTSESVGTIYDTDGYEILSGDKLELNKRYDIRADSIAYAFAENAEGDTSKRIYIKRAALAIGDFAEGNAADWVPPANIVHEFVDGFVRSNGTTATSTNYKYTGVVKYLGGDIEFQTIAKPTAPSWTVIAFYDDSFPTAANPSSAFLGALETRMGIEDFFNSYNIPDYNRTESNGNILAGIVSGRLTKEQIAALFPNAAYFAVTCAIHVTNAYTSIYEELGENTYYARQTEG